MNKFFIIPILIFTISISSCAQDSRLYQEINDAFEQIKEPSITHRRFKHKTIDSILQQLPSEQFEVKKVGESVEGKSISLVKIGQGPIKVLLWSQMHGNEPTATMAIMDIFNFFKVEDNMSELQKLLKDKLSLYFIPILNPDGADLYQRRNAFGIDLNRDALRLESPESRILKHVRDSLEADWGFNLHDQSRYYAAGNFPYQASMSFLAPAYNYAKDVNESRADAMQLIGKMNAIIQKYIPNQVGRYSDAFEPRAFGDNIQKWGTRTILIETGGLKGDREKQILRKIDYNALMVSFHSIATKSYERVPLREYESIPFNRYNAFHDIILRKINVVKGQDTFKLDVAIRNQEVEYDGARSFYFHGEISDLGDLSTSFGYEEIDGSDLVATPGKVYDKVFNNHEQLKALDPLKLIEQGYTTLLVNELPDPWYLDRLPLRLSPPYYPPDNEVSYGGNPSLIIKSGESLKYILVNGFLIDVEKDGMVIKHQFLEKLNEIKP